MTVSNSRDSDSVNLKLCSRIFIFKNPEDFDKGGNRDHSEKTLVCNRVEKQFLEQYIFYEYIYVFKKYL